MSRCLVVHVQVAYLESGLEAVIFTADGDMRQALNNLQVLLMVHLLVTSVRRVHNACATWAAVTNGRPFVTLKIGNPEAQAWLQLGSRHLQCSLRTRAIC